MLRLRVPRFLSRPGFSIYGLIVGFCPFGDGPVLGHNSEITNRHQTHIKPTASPRQTHTMADSMCTPKPTPNPDRAERAPRLEKRLHAKPSQNPHQIHTRPRTNQDIKIKSDNCHGSPENWRWVAAARRYVATLQRCSAKGSRRFHPGNFRCRHV